MQRKGKCVCSKCGAFALGHNMKMNQRWGNKDPDVRTFKMGGGIIRHRAQWAGNDMYKQYHHLESVTRPERRC